MLSTPLCAISQQLYRRDDIRAAHTARRTAADFSLLVGNVPSR